MTPIAAPDIRPIPSFFGPEDQRCFGWFHLPEGKRGRELGVVICKPFGYEAMCSHRALRVLAEQLCSAGFPVLRFDHYGAGDSAGNPGEHGLVHSWLNGVRTAADALRQASGATRICLFGLRLGATLAASAAALEPVESLVLWAPFRSGKLFVREAKTFQDLQGMPGPRVEKGGLEVAGFPVSVETIEDLSALDLSALRTAPSKSALLLGRDDLNEGTKLDEQLRSLGIKVERNPAPGYTAMLLDANDSRVPLEAIAVIIEHLSKLAPEGSLRPAPAPSPAGATLKIEEALVREEPLRFGADDRLFGILTTAAQPQAGRPVVLFLNVGSNHHVGPNRMYVVQSRALAARGITTLRFDVSGIGDSPPPPGAQGNRLYSPDAIVDVRAAIDLACARAGASKAALIGLCSGAYLAFHVTNLDERVIGQALLNQQTFYWREGDSLAIAMRRSVKSARFYKRALFDPSTWKRLLFSEIHLRVIAASFLRRFGARLVAQSHALRSFLTGRGWESSEIARLFRRALNRGSRVLLVFSDNDGGIDVMEQHLGQDGRKLASRPGFSLRILEGPDHTFTPVWSQEKLQQVLIDWIAQLAD